VSYNGYIAVEGPIGAGKTSLARLLADHLAGRLILEMAEENPFLSDFYKNRERAAFQTQVFFLMSRYAQQQQIINHDLFSRTLISDYLFAKDGIFARINLSDRELSLYNKIASTLESNTVMPDLVIYITASVDILIERIRRRGRDFERGLDRYYLEAVSDSYSEFFFHYRSTPLLVIKTDNTDFRKDTENFDYLTNKILSRPGGTEYISFDSLGIKGL
jgi:deoxyadenosine/deoxycytidine kinase